jgi:hypothetical protein
MADGVVRAACYYRMSTLKQEVSTDRQRAQVLPNRQRTVYEVAEAYSDEGIAGDRSGRRCYPRARWRRRWGTR